MNILFIAHERNMGGASKSLVTLASELRDRGHSVYVVLPMWVGSVRKELKKRGLKYKCIFFGWWMQPIEWGFISKLLWKTVYKLSFIPEKRIERYAGKVNAQIIHSNSSAIDIGARCADRLGIPHVWHVREFGDKDYRLEYMKGRKASVSYMEKIKGRVVFISNNLRNYYDDLSNEKARVIYNGVSENYLLNKYVENPVDNGDNHKEQVTFLVSGNMQRTKRQDLILQAADILNDRGYDKFRLIIAGGTSARRDSEIYADELRKLSKHLKNEVVFTGFVNNIEDYRKEADAEIVPSSREAFGRVSVEAMMASNPVIASRSGANPEIVEDGVTGLLFEEGNPHELADKMELFIKDRELIAKMGRNAYETALSRFPSKINTSNIEKLYGELL